MNCLFVAHFDTNGYIHEDLALFLNYLCEKGYVIHLISTGMLEEQKIKLNTEIKVTIRENIGYDFYSYALGFKDCLDIIEKIDNIILMNSSFKIYSKEKLSSFFDIATSEDYSSVDLLSLTESFENEYHCQSFLMRCNRNILNCGAFINWWVKMKPINKRQKVIDKYELGLTRFVLKYNFSVSSVLSVSLKRKIKAMSYYKIRYGTCCNYLNLNPCHFMWDAIYEDYGIIKYELLNKNPHGLDISKVL